MYQKIPTVSICIPVFNQLDYFKNALCSVLIQKFRDYEIIITDDSTNDDIYEYLKGQLWFGSLKYVRNTPSLGSPANWNKALSLATGKFIKILHHDDQFFDDESLGKFVDALESNPHSNVVFCSILNCNAQTGVDRIHRPTSRELSELSSDPSILFCGNYVGPPSGTLFRAPTKYLFNEKLKWLVDIDFYIQNWSGKEFFYLPQVLIKVTSGSPHQVTRSCEHDLQINIFEYLTVFDSIKENLSKQKYDSCIRMLKIIFANLNVQSIEQIRQAGYLGSIPRDLFLFISYIRANQFLAKCLAKL